MKFTGTGYFLSASTFEVKDEEGKLTTRYKYTFLTGDLVNHQLQRAEVHSAITDHPVLKGDPKIMEPIAVCVEIRNYNGSEKAVYSMYDPK